MFTAISAGNAHAQYGESHTSVTMSFAPGELSTVEGTAGATRSFNFEDLPCPPSDVALADQYFYNPETNPTRPYQPRILPPTQILDLDPAFKTCTFADIVQGFDPPKAVNVIPGAIAAPGPRHGIGRHVRRHLKTYAHTPTITSSPTITSKPQ